MFEQILQLKDRYRKLISKVTKEDITLWSTDFFGQYNFVQHIRWHHYTPYDSTHGDSMVVKVLPPEMKVTDGFAAVHPDIEWLKDQYGEVQQEGSYFLHDVHKLEDLKKMKAIWPAVAALRTLFLAEDILLHVFKDDVQVTLTKDGIDVVPTFIGG